MESALDFYKDILQYLLFIPLGLWVRKRNLIDKSWITKPLIYLLMPVLVIHHVLEAESSKMTILPIMSFLLSCLMIIPAKISKSTFAKDFDLNFLKCSFSFFNVAFFGIPVALLIYGEEALTLVITIYIGSALYGDLIGYYQMSRGRHSRKTALMKVFKVPFIYAFALALTLRAFDVESPHVVESIAGVFGTIVSYAGMFIIGYNLAGLNLKRVNWKFIWSFNFVKILSGPLFIGLLILLEMSTVNILDGQDREILFLVSVFPVAANVTVFASFFGAHEENSALLVLSSLVFSLLGIPVLMMLFQ